MHASVNGKRSEAIDCPPSRRWQDVVEAAQQALAASLAGALRHGGLDRSSYQHWLATESAICRIHAVALEALADWHVSSPSLRATAHAWATRIRDDALAAAADVRAIDGMAPALPVEIGRWQAFMETASGSSRAGEALGAVVLHARLMHGQASAPLTTVAELPFITLQGRRYLLRRAQGPGGTPGCDALLQAYSGSALAAGAQRAAAWYGAAMRTVLSSPA